MKSLIRWLAQKEINELEAQIVILKMQVNESDKLLEGYIKAQEDLEKKITGLEAVIDYAKNLHDQMFEIIRSFAPKPIPDAGQVGGVKSWSTVRKELEKKAKEGENG